MTVGQLAEKLRPYLPDGVELYVAELIARYRVNFKITKPRDSVYGDYMSPGNGHGHIITINGNQNKYAFFVTVLHEFAHLFTWEKYKNNVKPHGAEWKEEFRKVLTPFIKQGVFPPGLVTAIKSYIENPAASTCSDEDLLVELKNYDRKRKPLLKELPDNARFELNEMIFIKGKLVRKRYECTDVDGKAIYLISGLAEVNFIL